jgi:hypothetical protein
MKSLTLERLVQKTREELLGLDAKARSAERKAKAAAGMNRQAKLKLKQTKKLAKFAKKLAKKERKEALAAQQAVLDTRIKLRKTETKFLKKLQKVGAQSAQQKARPAKTTPKKLAAARLIKQAKPAPVQKQRQRVKTKEITEPAVQNVTPGKVPLPATLPMGTIPTSRAG